jgi:hypothetical protein
MTPTRFALIGGGWRAEFYLRIAAELPDELAITGLLVRDAAKGAALEQRFGVRTYRTLDALLAADKPDFVVTCVAWDANPPLVTELAARGLAVLTETPPARHLDGLRALYALAAQGARIQVAEQYIYQPHHAARLALVRGGALGTVSQAQVSAAHGYHGISLMRNYMGVGFDPVTIIGRAFESPLVGGPGRNGPPTEEKIKSSGQQIAWFDYGDRLGVFDFCGDQYFSWVRGQRLLVRGERGEIIDERARYLLDFRTPVEVPLQRMVAGANGNLEGLYLKGITAGEKWLYRNPFAPAKLTDDEIAIASVLVGMGAYAAGGPPIYPLAEGCHDHYLNILMAQAIESGQPVRSEPQPWG